MKQQLLWRLHSGLLAIGLVAGLSAPALALPLSPMAPTQPASSDVIQVDSSFKMDCFEHCRGQDLSRSNQWRAPAYRGNRNWNGNRNWQGDDRRGRRHYRRHDNYVSPGIYYDPGYRYVEPRRYVQPRRVYRANRLSDAHVGWCYDRWRSYRASDNSYQPLHGPRRQCRSPYS